MSDPLLEVTDLDVTYGGAVRALQGVSLHLRAGEVVSVLGSNGAGKTSLVRALSRSLGPVGGRQSAGKVLFDGEDAAGLDTSEMVRRGMVLVPEGRQIFGDLTVAENLVAGGFTERDRPRRRQARERVLDLFPILAERLGQRAGLLSGGQQQMLSIGRALMTRPRVLLLDEPSLGLAPQLVEQMGDLVTSLNESGTSVLLIEQNASMALRVASRAYVLSVGRVVEEGDAAELAAGDTVRERYLGTHEPTPAPPAAGAGSAPVSERVDSPDPRDLTVEDVTVTFRGVTALDRVSMTVRSGSVHALIGPNGAGKSTCINVLSGVYRPDSGGITYGARRISGWAPHRVAAVGIARTFQNLAISHDMTLSEVLMLGRHRLMHHGPLADALRLPACRRAERENREAVGEIAELLGLEHLLDERVGGLSYGHLKRIELGRAIAAQPEVLLLDEPVAGMAHGESQEMAEVIRRVQARLGLSVLLVEHDMSFVMGLAEQITVLDFGHVVADGPPAEVRSHPDVIRAYLGAGAA